MASKPTRLVRWHQWRDCTLERWERRGNDTMILHIRSKNPEHATPWLVATTHFEQALSLLRPRQRAILKLRVSGLSYGEIGDRVVLSRQRIHQLVQEATGDLLAVLDAWQREG